MIEEKERKDLVNKLFVEPRKQTIFMHHIPGTNYPCHVHVHTHTHTHYIKNLKGIVLSSVHFNFYQPILFV